MMRKQMTVKKKTYFITSDHNKFTNDILAGCKDKR